MQLVVAILLQYWLSDVQLLLGPNAAMSGVAHTGISATAMPQVAPPTASH